MVMIGEGKATYQGETLDGAEALKRAGLKPVVLSSKEGLILLSGTTSVTAFASLAIYDAQTTLAIELNSSVDNPLIFDEEDGGAVALMGCNADGTYAGMASDSLCIAITDLCKMSNSRIDRLLNSLVSELPAFLNKNADYDDPVRLRGSSGRAAYPRAPRRGRQSDHLRQPGGLCQHGLQRRQEGL